MDLNFLQATGAMLFHSVWQGAVSAAIAGIVMHCTKRSAAAIRYNLLLLVLILFCCTACCTFFLSFRDASTPVHPVIDNVQQTEDPSAFPDLLVVLIWIIAVFVRLIILGWRFQRARQLRNVTFLSDQAWQSRFDALKQALNIQGSVRLMQSALATVPFVVGLLKPVVIVPAGMLLSLPPAEAEAILLHELAHIRRQDFLVNIFQQITVSVFFFHPGILWICRLLSDERENCCDDIAARHCGSTEIYIHALVSYYEKAVPPGIMLGFSGHGYPLLNRVKRLINHHNKTLNFMEKIFLTAGLVLAGYFVYALPLQPDTSRPVIVQKEVVDTIIKEEPVEVQEELERVIEEKDEAESSADKTRTKARERRMSKRDREQMHKDIQEAREDARREVLRAKEDMKSSDLWNAEREEAISKAMKDAQADIADAREDIRDKLEALIDRPDFEHETIRAALNNARMQLKRLSEQMQMQKLDKKLIENAIKEANAGLEHAERALRDSDSQKK